MNIFKILFTFLLPALLIFSAYAQERDLTPLPIGEPAPDFHLEGIDGQYYSLSDFEEYDYLVVAFWANHCPTVQAYEDRFINLVDEYRPEGVGFVAISPNSPDALALGEMGYTDVGDELDDMILRAEDKGYNFPYLYDGDDHEGSLPYGPVATPHIFIFDQERTLRYRGRIDDTENPYIEPSSRDTRDALDALLAGEEIEVKETRSFGCSIKWKWDDAWKEQTERMWQESPVELDMIDIEGVEKLVANDTDNTILLNMWATWCGPCIMEFPHLLKIHRIFEGRGFEFVSLSLDVPNQKNSVIRFLEDQHSAVRNYLYDSTNKYPLMETVDEEWQGAIPHSVLIAPGGEIIKRYAGAVDELTLRRDLVEHFGRYFADDE